MKCKFAFIFQPSRQIELMRPIIPGESTLGSYPVSNVITQPPRGNYCMLRMSPSAPLDENDYFITHSSSVATDQSINGGHLPQVPLPEQLSATVSLGSENCHGADSSLPSYNDATRLPAEN